MIPKSRLMPRERIDSVEHRRRTGTRNNNLPLLTKSSIIWENFAPARRERERIGRYVYGDQWSDSITYKHNGRTVTTTEAEYIRRKGNVPLVNNVMRSHVNTVTGLYSKTDTEPVATARDRDEQKVGEMMSIALQCNWQKNSMRLLLTNAFEDYMIGGMVFEREGLDFMDGQRDIKSRFPLPSHMFLDGPMDDPLMQNIYIIGEIHDMPLYEVYHRFSHSHQDHELLRSIYRVGGTAYPVSEDIRKRNREDGMNFWTPNDPSLCRVYEIWTKELKERYRCWDPLEGKLYRVESEDYHELVELENESRIQEGLAMGMAKEDIALIEAEYVEDYYWFFQFLAPDGTILLEGENPFDHESHPYTVSFYPFVNGEIHPYAGDFLDQQRYINRLIILDDFVRRTGAKGVIMVPEDVMGGLTKEEFAEEMSSYDGIVFYKPKPGVPLPQQIYSSAANLGTVEMVKLMMDMMENIAQTNNALQGKQPYAGTSAALYSQQTANATASLSSLLLRFQVFTEQIAVKKTKMIQQYYDEKRIINIAGRNYAGVKEYDPEKARDIEFDLSIREGAATPERRMVGNDLLLEFWRNGAISIEQLLQNGDFDFADSLLQSIGAAKEQAEQTGHPTNIGAIPQNVQQSVNDRADMEAIGRANTMLRMAA